MKKSKFSEQKIASILQQSKVIREARRTGKSLVVDHTTPQAQELLEIIEERSGNASQILTSQLAVKGWFSLFKYPTLADAIMDRVIHNTYRLELEGDMMRKHKNRVCPSDTLP